MLSLLTKLSKKLKISNYRSAFYSKDMLNKSKGMEGENIMMMVKACIPPLDGKSHKGTAGRIGIVGGSIEYTGAPYFSGITALKVGADLVHIFCPNQAATVIKSYSPDLIVHPLLDRPKAVEEILPWLDRLHAIVIGPGLGRDPETFKVIVELLEHIKTKHIPLIIDADGLFLISQKPQLLKHFTSPVILTPNKVEFSRICEAVQGELKLNELGEKVSILVKGPTDQFISPMEELKWSSKIGGSGRRCGGQGDLLSGAMATFLHWMLSNADNLDTSSDRSMLAAALASYAASRLVRICNENTFEVKGRSMLAEDMINSIHVSFEELFGC